jgi:hypothetical protein
MSACLYYRDCWDLSLRFVDFNALIAFLEERLGKKGYLLESGPKGHTVYRNLDHALQARAFAASGKVVYEYGYDRPTATVEVIDEKRDKELASNGVELAA